MTPDQKLDVFFSAATPPSRDLVFMAATAQKIARRRAVLAVMACLPWALVATIVLWGLRPMVEVVGAALGELEPSLELVGFGAVALGLAFWLVRRFSPA